PAPPGHASRHLHPHNPQRKSRVINRLAPHKLALGRPPPATGASQPRRIPISLSASPKNLHGLSHREFGDYTTAEAVLTESPNPAMGRFRGRTSEVLVVEGRDPNYVRAARLKRLFVSFDDQGWPLKTRVARHLAAIEELINAYSELHPEAPIEVENIPQYKDVIARGLGAFLQPPPR